jgi:cAMP phosphodiesterase
MRVLLVPSSVSLEGEDQQFLSSYLINDAVAIDAGSIGFFGTAQQQAKIKHVFLSHTHIDHTASLPIFLENVYEAEQDCVTIHGSREVLDCLQTDMFNDRVWPDFIRLSKEEAPFLKLHTLEAGKSIQVDGLQITPVPVNHIVPTFGFVIEDEASAIIIASDTGPTLAVWEFGNQVKNLKAVFLEATFPEAMAHLAQISKHLTPTMFAHELQKLNGRPTIIAVHIKARFLNQIVTELKALAIPDLEIGLSGTTYIF